MSKPHPLLRENYRPLALALAERLWLANRYGFPSASLTTPDNPRTNENPNTPYNKLGAILETLQYGTEIFGVSITIHMRLTIGRDDWFRYYRAMPEAQRELIADYLDREPSKLRGPNLEHSYYARTAQCWDDILLEMQRMGLVRIWLETVVQNPMEQPAPLILENQCQVC